MARLLPLLLRAVADGLLCGVNARLPGTLGRRGHRGGLPLAGGAVRRRLAAFRQVRVLCGIGFHI